MILRELIREQREKLGLTQTELAFKVGYTDRSAIAKIETGQNGIPDEKIVLFSEVLNIPELTLLDLRIAESTFKLQSLQQKLYDIADNENKEEVEKIRHEIAICKTLISNAETKKKSINDLNFYRKLAKEPSTENIHPSVRKYIEEFTRKAEKLMLIPPDKGTSAEDTITDEEKHLLSKFRKLTPNNRETIIKNIDFLESSQNK